MKTLLVLLILLTLTFSVRAEQTIYYHYINIYDTPDGKRIERNIPHGVIKYLNEGWKITNVSSAGSYGEVVVIYILEKENK